MLQLPVFDGLADTVVLGPDGDRLGRFQLINLHICHSQGGDDGRCARRRQLSSSISLSQAFAVFVEIGDYDTLTRNMTVRASRVPTPHHILTTRCTPCLLSPCAARCTTILRRCSASSSSSRRARRRCRSRPSRHRRRLLCCRLVCRHLLLRRRRRLLCAAASCFAAAATGSQPAFSCAQTNTLLGVADRSHREPASSAAAWAHYFCVLQAKKVEKKEEEAAVAGEARGQEPQWCVCAFDLRA